MKTYKVTTWGQEYEVYLKKNSYRDNNSLAIQMFDASDGCPFTVLTVNLEETSWMFDPLPIDKESIAFVDTNNNPWAEKFIKDNKLGEPVGIYGHSGFCSYPLYRFDLSKLD